MTRSRRTSLVAALALALVLAACASLPTGPSIMALPGTGKSFADFQRDDENCRGWAERQIGASPAQAQTQGALGGAAIGTGVGAAAGTLIGVAARDPGAGAAIGAGTGLVVGSAAGASPGERAPGSLQH